MDSQVSDAEMRAVLLGEHDLLRATRRRMQHVPSSPRCKLCSAPFGGVGGAVLKHFGYARFAGNPALCEQCIRQFRSQGLTGAEIPVTLLFADIRGSTAIGERLSPRDFLAFLNGFYRIASEVVTGHDGLVDKFVGDEVIGLFFPGVTGPEHSRRAIEAATTLVARTGLEDATPMGPIPLGAAVHTGEAYVGTTGPQGAADDFTALGDVVNTTARLTGLAAAGELLISLEAATAATHPIDGLERRTLDIRGRHGSVEVVVVRPVPATAEAAGSA